MRYCLRTVHEKKTNSKLKKINFRTNQVGISAKFSKLCGLTQARSRRNNNITIIVTFHTRITSSLDSTKQEYSSKLLLTYINIWKVTFWLLLIMLSDVYLSYRVIQSPALSHGHISRDFQKHFQIERNLCCFGNNVDIKLKQVLDILNIDSNF